MGGARLGGAGGAGGCAAFRGTLRDPENLVAGGRVGCLALA